MLLISSWIKTVLPTPAPPNKTSLTTLSHRADKVNDLNTGFQNFSTTGLIDEWWWSAVNRCSVVKIAPLSSIGSPMTLNIRPKVFSPTGTLIGRASIGNFSTTFKPSVELSDIARTLVSLKCWATSRLILVLQAQL